MRSIDKATLIVFVVIFTPVFLVAYSVGYLFETVRELTEQ